jgi:hypothetical protein
VAVCWQLVGASLLVATCEAWGDCERRGGGTETVTKCRWNLAFEWSFGGGLMVQVFWVAACGAWSDCGRRGRRTETVTESGWNLAFAWMCGGSLLAAACWNEFDGGSLWGLV